MYNYKEINDNLVISKSNIEITDTNNLMVDLLELENNKEELNDILKKKEKELKIKIDRIDERKLDVKLHNFTLVPIMIVSLDVVLSSMENVKNLTGLLIVTNLFLAGTLLSGIKKNYNLERKKEFLQVIFDKEKIDIIDEIEQFDLKEEEIIKEDAKLEKKLRLIKSI